MAWPMITYYGKLFLAWPIAIFRCTALFSRALLPCLFMKALGSANVGIGHCLLVRPFFQMIIVTDETCGVLSVVLAIKEQRVQP